MTHHRHHLGERNLRIGVKIWLFFMLFVCVVFLLMWLFQIIFLEWFYESMKIRDTAYTERRRSSNPKEAGT